MESFISEALNENEYENKKIKNKNNVSLTKEWHSIMIYYIGP